ncbi:MAG: hypothetical protein KJZ65_11735 [Phycisphaerales bacterium]|nr:hypothetical protein [Phycisphaerales bacterium]
MPIHPLPQFEEDLRTLEEERRAIEALRPPRTIVVRFGLMGLIGEYPYRGDATPGCGSKIVVRTHRGIELGDMLTSTCPNAGCSKSVSREDMLEYIERSGGRQYPFFNNGRALRVATMEDLKRQEQIDSMRADLRRQAREVAERIGFPLKIVDVEPILSGDRLTVYFASEDRVDTRPLSQELAMAFQVRVDVRQIGARDEARLAADYERCGQYCCCKNFLKVLKPISMKAAKTQKATLDPLKISGRCGRLMCCLRYEEQTYEELRKNLPKRKTRVGTPDGDGIVIDSQILTQLVLVLLDSGKQVAVPIEQLTEPGLERTPALAPEVVRRPERGPRPESRPERVEQEQPDVGEPVQTPEPGEQPRKRKRRRRRKPREEGLPGPSGGAVATGPGEQEGGEPESSSREDGAEGGLEGTTAAGERSGGEGERPRKRRRRRRRKPREDGQGPAPAPEA